MIRAAGLDPGDFTLLDRQGTIEIHHRCPRNSVESTSILRHQRPAWFTWLSIEKSGRITYLLIWRSSGSRHVKSRTYWGWTTVQWAIRRGLRGLAKERAVPDLWADFISEMHLLRKSQADWTENTPFTATEQGEIREEMDAFRATAKHKHGLSDAQMTALDANIEYLVQSARRLGRIDWRNALVGTLFAFSVELALSSDSARGVLHSVLSATAHMFAEVARPLA